MIYYRQFQNYLDLHLNPEMELKRYALHKSAFLRFRWILVLL